MNAHHHQIAMHAMMDIARILQDKDPFEPVACDFATIVDQVEDLKTRYENLRVKHVVLRAHLERLRDRYEGGRA